MSSSSTKSTSDSKDLRLPPYFPIVPKECVEEAAPFFKCFSEKSVYDETKSPNVGREALAACWHLIDRYNTCVEKYLPEKRSTIHHAPESYLVQTKD